MYSFRVLIIFIHHNIVVAKSKINKNDSKEHTSSYNSVKLTFVSKCAWFHINAWLSWIVEYNRLGCSKCDWLVAADFYSGFAISTRKPSWRKGYARQRRYLANRKLRHSIRRPQNPSPNQMQWIGCTVCEIFAFKLYCDLETGVRAHLRSSKVVLLDRAHTTIYSS